MEEFAYVYAPYYTVAQIFENHRPCLNGHLPLDCAANNSAHSPVMFKCSRNVKSVRFTLTSSCAQDGCSQPLRNALQVELFSDSGGRGVSYGWVAYGHLGEVNVPNEIQDLSESHYTWGMQIGKVVAKSSIQNVGNVNCTQYYSGEHVHMECGPFGALRMAQPGAIIHVNTEIYRLPKLELRQRRIERFKEFVAR